MIRRTPLSLATLGALAYLCISNGVRADETLKFRTFTHATSTQSQEIGDVDGHTASLARFSGLAALPDGSVGMVFFISATDYIKGAGSFSAYNNLTLKDGSVLWYKAVGAAAVDGTTTVFKGTVTVLGGKGKYAGAKGDGTLTGTRLTSLTVGADLYNDITINLRR